jgi:hypothetical protein
MPFQDDLGTRKHGIDDMERVIALHHIWLDRIGERKERFVVHHAGIGGRVHQIAASQNRRNKKVESSFCGLLRTNNLSLSEQTKGENVSF